MKSKETWTTYQNLCIPLQLELCISLKIGLIAKRLGIETGCEKATEMCALYEDVKTKLLMCFMLKPISMTRINT